MKINYLLLFIYLCLITISCLSIYMFLSYPMAKVEEIIYQINAPIGKLSYVIILPIIEKFIFPFFMEWLFVYIVEIKKNIAIRIFIVFLYSLPIALIFYYYDISYCVKMYTESNCFIEEKYKSPKDVDIKFEHKRNLIHIYLESMENTYSCKKYGGAFDDNRIPNLTELSIKNINFGCNSLNGPYSVFGTTWTMGSTFSTESGLPLKTIINDINSVASDNYFNSIITLGDILKDNGYINVVMTGTDSNFAAAKSFFLNHGYTFVFDLYEAYKENIIPSGYSVWWGFEDEKLFSWAKSKILELNRSGKPFNFTLFTMDTHFEDGYVCNNCEKNFSDQYSNVIYCSDKQVYCFVDWLKSQSFFENTTIVIHGDHLTMDSDYLKDIDNLYMRKNYFTIINPEKDRSFNGFVSREYSTLDLFPTIISAIGGKIDGDSLGLGKNLFSDKKTLVEEIGLKKLNDNLLKKSFFMEKLNDLETEVL